jgi:hypothetical protein
LFYAEAAVSWRPSFLGLRLTKPLKKAVIPAKAGIQLFSQVEKLDSSLRWNDEQRFFRVLFTVAAVPNSHSKKNPSDSCSIVS